MNVMLKSSLCMERTGSAVDLKYVVVLLCYLHEVRPQILVLKTNLRIPMQLGTGAHIYTCCKTVTPAAQM